ncbi:MAG: alpha/beta hydrolase fold domain-containing protein [Myxococcales bacterium]
MSLYSRPAVARSIARLMQAGTEAGAERLTRASHARLPEFPRRCESLEFPTRFGPARLTVYRPAPEIASTTPPVHVNLHGGGYVLSLTELDDPLCRALAAQAGVVVLNVDYVVAPQHPFPEPPQQVYEVVRWVAENGSKHGWDGSKLTVGGQSAGGALAAAAARLALEHQGPAIALQVLHYPPLDLSIPASQKRASVSKPMLRPWMGDVFDTSYAPDPASRSDRLISPAGAADTADLKGIAPAVVILAEKDLLRAEGQRYADRLSRAGALVELRVIAGADHGYDGKDDALAREVYAFIAGHLRRPSALAGRA